MKQALEKEHAHGAMFHGDGKDHNPPYNTITLECRIVLEGGMLHLCACQCGVLSDVA